MESRGFVVTETSSSAEDLVLTDVLLHLAANEVSEHPGRTETQASESRHENPLSGTTLESAAGDACVEPASGIAQLDCELESTKAALRGRERALQTERRRVQELQEQLQQQISEVTTLRQQLACGDSIATTKAGAANVQNPFDIVLTLSSEREAALRERKLYKDRAADAEANAAQLESDLAAAYANTKVQVDRADKLAARCDDLRHRVAALQSENGAHQQRIACLEAPLSAGHCAVEGAEREAPDESDAVATLSQRLQERDRRIAELEKQLTDRVGAPTMVGGELERLAVGALPTVVYALESLDIPGELHKLTRPTNTVGRSAHNDISLASSSVSRFHARLLYKPEGVWLADLQSVNGCLVNDQRTLGQILSEGDLVVIGDCRFRFSALTSHHSAPTPSPDQA
jgi:chaperonin cofactor prefoldin